VNERWAKSAQYRLISENETRFFGLSRFDQSFLKARYHSDLREARTFCCAVSIRPSWLVAASVST
jgi:hypothetical protein